MKVKLLKDNFILVVGSIGPLGWLPASGTIAVAVAGIPLFWWMSHWPWWLYVSVTIAFALASVWLHHVGDRILGEKDSRKLVWDELAGFMVAVAFVPFTWRIAIVAFFLERIIDIVKVPPAHWIEKRWPGGWGVVGDDLMAGIYTLIILHFLVRFAPAWCGLPLAAGG